MDHAKFARAKLEKLEGRIQRANSRISMHEKIVASIVSAGGIAAGVWQLLRR